MAFLLLFFAWGCKREEGLKKSTSSQAPKAEKTTVDLVAFGDFMAHKPQLRAAQTPEGFDFSSNFIYLADPYIKKADLALINLETTLTDGRAGYTSFPVFSSPKEIARDLKAAGFSIVSTANNHSYDKLKPGLDSTIDYLKEASLDYIGTGKEEAKPLIKEVKGMKIGFLSYTYGLNGFDQTLASSENPGAVGLLSEENIVRDTSYLKNQGVDAIVAFVHWGEEYQAQANEYQAHYFEILSNNGVILTLGSHPHVAQGVGYRKVGDMEAYVAYSMGNFVSNQRREYMKMTGVEWGLMVRARLEKGEDGRTRLVAFDPRPLYVDTFHQNGGRTYQVIPIQDALNGDLALERMDQLRGKLEEYNKTYRDLIPGEMVLMME